MTTDEDNVDPAAVADTLRKLLNAVDHGEITATRAERHRLEGAVTALDAVAQTSN
ncbi:hypothetical protein [Geodermatophilus sp. Leaf369]|uniref:hypothetical protein n=1 Tax=Geodermatophilus sp. Leaf369 TaxID=1736354 RepID=UPI00190FE951|nr:hypothetical protein [Geodermatophilus sp. Leaf369]